MGKSLSGATKLPQLSRTASKTLKSSKVVSQNPGLQDSKRLSAVKMEGSSEKEGDVNNHRLPLSEVVSECVKRWFKDTLKEAKAGDINMQVLVSQMYYSGYGVPKDDQKGKIWMTRASRMRSSVWKVSEKRPGYNASDSDSE